MGAVTQAMASAAKAAGAEIRTGAEVIEIRVQNGVATGVLLSTGEEIHASAPWVSLDGNHIDVWWLTPDVADRVGYREGVWK